jgi:hypothetical protein
MRRTKALCGLMGVGVCAALAAPSHAQESGAQTVPTSSFRFEGSVGAEYNSNVNVADLDTSTGQGDWAGTINLLAEGTFHPVQAMTLRAGYDFSQTLHQDFDTFDLTLHRGYAEAAYDFDIVTVGVLGNLALAQLDGDDYLTYSQVSPYISKQFGNSLFLRGSYAYTDKEFDGRPTRDATSDAFQLDSYIFLDGVKRYFVLGVKHVDEDAVSSELDYGGNTGKVRFQQRFDALDREMIFRAGVEYEDRDYDNVTLSIGAPRSDQRTTFDLSLEAPISEHFFTELSYRHGGYKSNLASADYDEDVGAIRIGVRY